MASGSPPTRIDQFYASRKRKPQGFKGENLENDRRTAPEESPGAKGSLVNYLVRSPDARHRLDPVKRNLALEIGLSSDATSKPFLSACSLRKTDGGGAQAAEEEELVVGSNGRNSELKKFANDFLSLYCSELPSSVLCPVEQEHKSQKRNLSPLSAEDNAIAAKKKCVLDSGSATEAEYHSSDKGHPEVLGSRKSCKTVEEVVGSANKASLSMKRSSKSPNSSFLNAGFHTPGLAKTPRSLSRSSMFSPGDEFWNEAIQVADGLHGPVDGLNNQGEGESMCLLMGMKPGGKVPMDASSCIVSRDSGNFPKLVKDDLEAQGVELGGCEKSLEGSNKSQAVVQNDKVSPLPVKHLDFSHDENNFMAKRPISERLETVAAVSIPPMNGSSLQRMGAQPFDGDSSSHVVEGMNSRKSSSAQKLHQIAQVVLDGAKLGPCFLTRTNGIDHQENDYNVSIGLSKGGCGSSNTGDRKNNAAGNKSNEDISTPSNNMSPKDCLQLDRWLPPEICSVYMKKGISKLYPWQVDCLMVDGVLERRNLVYCASTSAGKSFVAEILMLRRVILTGQMALLVLPYVSICAEKAEHLELVLEPLGKHVRSFYGNQGGGSLPKDTSVAVCTIEKANSLINKLLEEGRLSELSIIVIDELHMVGDQHRGYLLELMLTKLRYAAGEGSSESSSGESSGSSTNKADPAHGLQIIGMSATMPNVAAVADWLRAALYQTDFRPVPLEEYIKIGNTIFDKKLDVIRTIPKIADFGGKDPDHIVELCNEVVQEGHSVLLFCSSRKGCETTARHLSKFLKKFSVATRDACEFNDASSAIEALRKCPAGLDPVLEETLPSGVAYHHAGLTVEEREIVETCYRKGLVRVLTATSTLAAGVNLPARRVIFRQPKIGQAFLDGTRYRQMAGRAGRTGIDTKGESILICKPEELKRVSAMLNDNCPPLQSCLSEDKNGMTHAILEVVAGGIVQTAQDIHRYVRCTLLNSTKPFQDVVKSAQDSLRWLCHNKFLEWNEETSLYNTTPLGRAAFGSSLSPEESLVVLDDLLRAREGFVLASDLHLVYLVTPINIDIEPDWELYYERFMELSALDQSVGNRVGVVEPFLMRMAHGAPLPRHNGFKGKKVGPYNSPQTRNAAGDNILLSSDKALRVSKRFYVALMLSRLIQEVPVADVCMAFKVARGMIQALQENAGRFASMVSLFCERLGWQDLEGLVAKFQNRVSFGVRAEIVELTNIPYVKGSRARSLYKAGLRTPLAIAEASVSDIVKALFEFTSWAGEESLALRRMQLGIAKKIKNGARKIILDQAEEARLAAFSAFKSLGFHVPQFSRPLLPINAEGSASEGGSMGSSHEGFTSCFDASKSGKNVHVSMQQAGEDKSLLCGDTSQATTRQNFYKNSSDLAAKQVSSAIATVGDPNIENAEPVTEVFPKSLVSLGKLDATDVETSAPASSPMQKKGDITGDVDVKTGSSYIGEHVQGDNKADSFGANISDEGPVSVNTTEGGLDLFLDKWDAAKEFYFDVHFTKHSEVNSCILFEVTGFAICWENSPVYYINLMKDLVASGKQYKCHGRLRSSTVYKNRGLPSGDTWKVAKYRWKRIAKIMERSGVRKITWNLKVQIQVLKIPTISLQRYGRLSLEHNDFDGLEVVNGPYLVLPSMSIHDGIDICLVSWILWPDDESKSSPNLEKVVKNRLSSEAAAAANRDGRWRNQMHKAAHNGCCRRVAQIRALDSVLWKLLVSENLVETLTEVENPLVKVLADMELWGIGIDMEACLRARHILVRKLKELEKEAYDLAGMHFSLNNAADIANVLYRHLKLPIPGSCTKGKQHPSTNKHSLDLLRDQHPIIAVIKEHRSLAKLLNGTLGSICSRAKLCAKSHRYTIHGHWLQTSTATGRLSIEEPNLQCIEHVVVFKSQQSEEKLKCSPEIDHHQINARDFFIPTEDNWLLLTADYSQIELRLMAHFSKDSSLIELLSEPNGDVFTMIAARWASKRESAVSSQERDHTKRLLYGILYGMGTHTLAEQLECSSEEATEKIKSFKASFPGVSSWLQAAVASCHQKGYVETLNGRKRYLPKIKFGNSKERAKAQRQAVNSICQGSAADIIKIAMINIHSVIAKECKTPDMNSGLWTNFTMLKGHCRIILQVHDELVLEVDAKFLKEAGNLLQMSMESAVSLLVPLHVKLKSGRTWGSLQPFKQEP